jgi:anti-sigma regulatory factor (Ser/Thr protein kinase)/serine/threonine protein phosphatase PrpC
LEQSEQLTVVISCSADEGHARRAARTIATGVGFDEKAIEEIVIVASELASNLTRHARGGNLLFTQIAQQDRDGVQIESQDMGPGIGDVNQALADGFSTVGSLGYGLGTVNRLMDDLEIQSKRGPKAGTYIVCRRWLRKNRTRLVRCPLSFGAATRSHPAMNENGDAFVIEKASQCAVVGVIDGLGHGQFAHRAAQAARHYVDSHFEEPLVAVFRGTGRACRGTRGVVMALARFDWEPDAASRQASIRLSVASIGNIETRVVGSLRPMHFQIRRGIVGVNAPEPWITEHEWGPGLLLVMHSDGLSSHWRLSDFPEIAQAAAPSIAGQLLKRLAKDNDDATVIVVKSKERTAT